MKKRVLLIACLVVVGLVAPSMAAETGGVTSIEERIDKLEEAVGRTVGGDSWFDRIQLSGLIEVEAGYVDPENGDKESDVDLATVELGVDARIVDHVDGHVLFKWEDDDLFVDEGFITLTGSEAFPAYLIAGRQYVPFGNFDSHFIADPNTLVLGETNEGAVVAGYRIGGELVDIAVGAFNGKIDEDGEDDDMIDGYVASVSTQPFEGLALGLSYISSIGSSDSLSQVVNGPVADFVAGWSAFATFEFLDRFRLIGEYTAALDEFEVGELYGAPFDAQEQKPSAWNAEFGVMVVESVELAIRYGGSDDGGDFLPETQYGGVVNWGVFESTNLALEYLHDEFEDDSEIDTVTAQLAIEF